jgi:hypothetical protein
LSKNTLWLLLLYYPNGDLSNSPTPGFWLVSAFFCCFCAVFSTIVQTNRPAFSVFLGQAAQSLSLSEKWVKNAVFPVFYGGEWALFLESG